MFNETNSSDLLEFLEFNKSLFMENANVNILFTVIMGSLCVLTTIGNLCVIYQYRDLSYVGNLFINSLACADLIVGCFVMPLASIYAVTNVWSLSRIKFKLVILI